MGFHGNISVIQRAQKTHSNLQTKNRINYFCIATRGFQKFNPIPRVEFFISLSFAEPTTHVIQAHVYIW